MDCGFHLPHPGDKLAKPPDFRVTGDVAQAEQMVFNSIRYRFNGGVGEKMKLLPQSGSAVYDDRTLILLFC